MEGVATEEGGSSTDSGLNTGEAQPTPNSALLRLSQVESTNWAADFHPKMKHVDDITQEFRHHWRLLSQTWSITHWRALVVGSLAFIIGVFSQDTFTGGDPFIAGLDGIRSLDGFGFFQLLLSLILWIWFILQLWRLYPVLQGHAVNLMVAWMAGMVGMILFHASSPQFPLEIGTGDMLGGLVCLAVMLFFVYNVSRAVTETRDDHVQVKHFSEDPREMEAQLREHSLKAWTAIVAIWLFFVLLNTWSGAHFIADRHAEKLSLLIIHAITGIIIIAGMMHILWFPQLMLGTGTTKVISKRAREASADSQGEWDLPQKPATVKPVSGICPECRKASPIRRSESGEALVPCPREDCEGEGSPKGDCNRCKSAITSRWTCESCGVNSPVLDHLPDKEAW